MKNFTLGILILVGILFSNTANAQTRQSYQLKQNSYEQIKLSYQFDIQNLQVKNIKTENGIYSQLAFADMTPSQETGKPELPILTQLLEIPLCESIQVDIVNSEYVIYNCAEIGIRQQVYPVQPKHPKSENGPFPFVIDEETYNTNEFYSLPLAHADITGVLRDINIGRISIAPFEYNPVTGQLKVYTHLEVEISFVNSDIPGTIEMKNKHSNGLFDGQHCGIINSMDTPGHRDEFSSTPIKYLIVAHSMFRDNENLVNFINWKKRIGYLVEIAYTDDSNVGTTTTSIQNFIKAQYDNATATDPAPTFLLLIGDVEQIPAFTGQSSNEHITDLYYACWTTGDHLPDCYYGRFSAQNISQLIPQIEKTLVYEQYTMPDPSYLNNAVLIAGTDENFGPTHGNGQINYAADNYFNASNGYTTVYTHLYDCSSQAATIRAEINEGVSFANYTAHGSPEGWANPGFTNSHVSAMNNANKYGIMIGNCCSSGVFAESSCFGETLLRAENKGAVIYIGASNSTYWGEDFYWAVGARNNINANPIYNAAHLGAYDRIFHTHNEAHSQWFTTAGGLNTAGNLAIESSTSSSQLYYWEIYHVFGDPSLKPYLSEPSTMNIIVPNGSIIGAASFDFTAVPYAYAAITRNNELISAAFANANGQVSIPLPENLIPGQYEIAISAQNYIQFFQTIYFAPQNSFYAVSTIDLGNNEALSNDHLNNWDLHVENIGSIAGTNVRAKIQALTPNIFFIVDSAHIGTLNGSQTVNLSHVFTSRTIASLNNNERISVKVTILSDNGSFERIFNYNANAPELLFDHVVLNANTANEGAIYPGENGTITFFIKNNGRNGISNLNSNLASHHNDVTVNSNNVTVGNIESGETAEVSFSIDIAATATIGSRYPLSFSINNTEYELSIPYTLTIGSTMEDFESNSFTAFAWTNGSFPWEITSDNVYAGSYCARSMTGLSDGSGGNNNSDLIITLNVTEASPISYFRKVSSEYGYDKFSFAIDGSIKEELSGEEEWGQVSFDVTPGNHTFRFRYSKDYSVSNGSDCAWIDNIVFPISGQNQMPTSPVLVIDHYDIEGTYANNIVLLGNEPVVKVTFKNVGSTVANNIQATLSTTDDNISINNNGTSDVINFSSMAVNSSKTAQYSINRLNEITEDQTVILHFTLTCGNTTTSCPIMLTYLNAEYHENGVDLRNIDKHITLYPNPTENFFTVSSSIDMIRELTIYDNTGREVLRQSVNDYNGQVNVANLSPGLYFVRMTTPYHFVTKKLIVR